MGPTCTQEPGCRFVPISTGDTRNSYTHTPGGNHNSTATSRGVTRNATTMGATRTHPRGRPKNQETPVRGRRNPNPANPRRTPGVVIFSTRNTKPPRETKHRNKCPRQGDDNTEHATPRGFQNSRNPHPSGDQHRTTGSLPPMDEGTNQNNHPRGTNTENTSAASPGDQHQNTAPPRGGTPTAGGTPPPGGTNSQNTHPGGINHREQPHPRGTKPQNSTTAQGGPTQESHRQAGPTKNTPTCTPAGDTTTRTPTSRGHTTQEHHQGDQQSNSPTPPGGT
nr:basic salivary proline-rich protein 4-like [Salvelinus alpinus]